MIIHYLRKKLLRPASIYKISYFGPPVKKVAHAWFRHFYKCHRNESRRKVTSNENKSCPARMDVTIKLVTRESKAYDKLVSTHPCIIHILNEHNHSFNDAINLGSLKFSEKTKEKFFSYFDNGMSASQASRFHETQTVHLDGLIGFANTAINPKHRSFCYLHNKWRHYNFGTYGGEDMKPTAG